MKALLLAAGKGVRMRPLTDNRPKAMVQLKGRPLLAYSLRELSEAGITECGIVTGKLGEKIVEHFGDNYAGIKLKYFKQKEALGTAHAVSVAESWLDEDFVLGSADVLAEQAVYRKLVEKKGFDSVMVLRHDDFPERYGVVKTEGEKVVEITEKPREANAEDWVNAGIYRFSPKLFAAIRDTKKSKRNEFELTDSIKLMMARGRKVSFVELSGWLMDIGSIADLERAESSDLEFFPGL